MKMTAAVLAMVILLSIMGASFAQESPKSFDTIGLYTDLKDHPEMFAMLKACGYNTYEILDNAFGFPPSQHEYFYTRLSDHIEQVKKEGMKVYVILMSNMEQTVTPGENKYLHGLFPPRDEALMKERMDYIRVGIRNLKAADGFIFFAGDPGGYPGEETAINDCAVMARKVHAMVKEEAPGAEYIFNLWAIAAWDHLPSPMTVDFWKRENPAYKEVLALTNLYGPEMSIEFPLHNYYRSLALKCYTDAGEEPELYPTAEVVASLYKRDVKHVWGWPYFLIDECDDGFSGRSWSQTQLETRYLHQIVDKGRELGLNGMIGNLSINGALAEVLNVYAFGRFCKDATATPEGVIREFAGFIAEPASVDDLVQVLAYIEHNSTWEAGMPEKYRLAKFDFCKINNPEEAAGLIGKVIPLTDYTFPLPGKPADYLDKLAKRIKIIQEQNADPVQ